MYGAVKSGKHRALNTLNEVQELQAQESGHGKVRTTRIEFRNLEVTMVDNAGTVAYGSQEIYDFQTGMVNVLASRGSLTQIRRTAGNTSTSGMFAAWDGDWGVGTVAANNGATLATTEQDIVPTTATAQAVLGTSAGSAAVATTAAGLLDGHSSAIKFYLNLLVDDTDHDITTLASNLLADGYIEFTWIDGGDDV